MDTLHPRPTVSRPQASGIIFAYYFCDGEVRRVSERDLIGTLEADKGWVWLHLPSTDNRARSFISDFEPLPQRLRGALLRREMRMRLTSEDGFITGLLPDLEREVEGSALGFSRFAFAMNDRLLVTVRARPLVLIADLRNRLSHGLHFEKPSEVVEWLGLRFCDYVASKLNAYMAQLDKIEDLILSEDYYPDGSSGLGPARRALLRHHREMLELHTAMTRGTTAVTSTTNKASPRALLPHFATEVEDLEREAANLQDRGRILHEEIDARTANDTNKVLRTLTILSTLLMPLMVSLRS